MRLCSLYPGHVLFGARAKALGLAAVKFLIASHILGLAHKSYAAVPVKLRWTRVCFREARGAGPSSSQFGVRDAARQGTSWGHLTPRKQRERECLQIKRGLRKLQFKFCIAKISSRHRIDEICVETISSSYYLCIGRAPALHEICIFRPF